MKTKIKKLSGSNNCKPAGQVHHNENRGCDEFGLITLFPSSLLELKEIIHHKVHKIIMTLLSVFFVLSIQAQPGTVIFQQKISSTYGNFVGPLDNSDLLGWSAMASVGDMDGDGISDIVTGAAFDDDGASDSGALWVLFLNSDGTVKSHQKISSTQGNFTGTLETSDMFGHSVASLGDLDGDGVTDIVAGAIGDDDGGSQKGAVWVLFLNSDGTVKTYQKISETQGNFTGTLDWADWFGYSVSSIGDLDGDGVTDIAVGARFDSDGGNSRGAVWVLFMNSDGTVKSHQKISDTQGNFDGSLDNSDYFGWSVASLGDLDKDGVADIAVGATFDDDGENNSGAVWILFLNSDGTVKSHQKISNTQGNFTETISNYDLFGASVTSVGDLDGDNTIDIAVGAYQDDDGGATGSSRGAVWVLFLNEDGTVKAHQKISQTQGNFSGSLDNTDGFGTSLALIGDLDGDGKNDIAAGAYQDDDGGNNTGAVWVLFLEGNSVSSELDISFSTVDVSCYGGNDGSIEWTFGTTTGSMLDLPAGTFTVILADSNGNDTTINIVINEPALLLASVFSATNVSCNGGSDGYATVTSSGGTPPYTCQWNTAPVQTSVTATGLPAGYYNITVTDNNGCNSGVSITISEPAELIASISSVTCTSTGNCNGDASVVASGGVEPYTYLWNDPDDQVNETATGLCDGIYDVTVSDAKGCYTAAYVIIYDTLTTGIPVTVDDIITGFNVYPNPSTGKFTIKMESTPDVQNIEISIINMVGQVVFSDMLSEVSGSILKKIDIEGYPNGIYTINVMKDEQQLLRKKIVIVKNKTI
ncbi:MAG: T9SS type A sorting domain-containing protein [Bacteroidota bacterium]